MTPKEYLMQIQKLNVLIDQRIAELDELRHFDGVSGIDYSKDRVQTSPQGEAPFVKVIEKIMILEEQINGNIDKFVDLKNKVIGEIQGLSNPVHIQILYKKYVEFKRLEVIAVEMNYSYDYIKHQHGYALQAFGRMYLQG